MACAKKAKRKKVTARGGGRGGTKPMAESSSLKLPSRKTASRTTRRKTGARVLKVRGTTSRRTTRKC